MVSTSIVREADLNTALIALQRMHNPTYLGAMSAELVLRVGGEVAVFAVEHERGMRLRYMLLYRHYILEISC